MRKMVYEVLEEFEAAKTKEEQLEVLKKNGTIEFTSTLKLVFDPRIKFIPIDIPKFNPLDTPAGMGYTTIFKEMHRMYIFMENHPQRPNLTKKRQEELLIQLLESMEPKEANVFIKILQKDLSIKGLTVGIINEAYPHLLDY